MDKFLDAESHIDLKTMLNDRAQRTNEPAFTFFAQKNVKPAIKMRYNMPKSLL